MHLAARHADTEAWPVLLALADPLRDALEHERGAGRAVRVVADGSVLAEEDHQLVADDLVHLAAGAFHERDDRPVVRVQHRRHLVGRVSFRERRVARKVGEDDADVADARESLVEVERAEPLFVPLRPSQECDEQERGEHQDVPLPPRDLPVPRPRDDDHRFGQEHERERECEDEAFRPSSMELEEAERGDPVERAAQRRENELPAVELLGEERIVQRRELRERDHCPADDERRE